MSARLIQVIEATEKRGKGIDELDPVREVTQYYAPDGTLLAERDPWIEKRERRYVQLGSHYYPISRTKTP